MPSGMTTDRVRLNCRAAEYIHARPFVNVNHTIGQQTASNKALVSQFR